MQVSYGVSFTEYCAEEAKRLYGDIIPATLPDRMLFVLKEVVPALACGCIVVIKPSELMPLTALKAANLSLQAGIPTVRKITFTGSTAVGKKLMAGAIGIVKKSATKFCNIGQTFVCTNRVLVQEGPCWRQQPQSYEPTVLAVVKGEMLISSLILAFHSTEEVFGPVALLKFKTEGEAICLANDTNAGLVAYIFTTNVQRSWRVSKALEYGIVGVNEGLVSTEAAPFGCVKESGLGREGSKYGIDEFLEVCLFITNSKVPCFAKFMNVASASSVLVSIDL
ncbi:unnamed protein product [Fraxinus pennsylvanica]|uniref:Aldehyde dehydrogenase domain-containing protein n=1 Tax=Fraxinus pennsylvanica TaxID=56036 RepID=A0AAD1YUH5_9LAMI|nr:unnamed protein product [Fraxinus pennsylvanica]